MAEGLVEGDGISVEFSVPSLFSQLKEAAERKDFISFRRIADKIPSDLIDPSTGYYHIHVVFEQNFVEASRYLLDIDHTLLDKRDKNGNTPLHIACAKGHVNLIEEFTLLNDDTPVNNEGHSLLHVAVSASKLEIIRVLLLKGFNPYQVTKDDKLNCLHIASKKGIKDIVEYFINDVGMSPQSASGANKDLDRPGGQQPIHFAALNGHLLLLKYLINEHHCDPNAEDNSGKNPAFYAGECGKLEVMKYLIEEKGCDPSHTARATGKVAANRQAIHGACFSGSLPIVQYLIGRQVDAYAIDGAKVTPLACAAQEGKLDIVRYLLQPENTVPHRDDKDIKRGPNVQDATGRTPLHYACLKDRHEVVQFLCTDGKADVNLLDNSGETGLIIACKSGHKNIVCFLLIDIECDEGTSTSGGRRVIDFASHKNWLDIITHLVQNRNYNPEQLNEIGFSAIHYAAEGNALSVLQYYLEDRKCDPNVMSSEGETGTTPLHRACMFGHFEVTQYLIKDRKCPLITATKNILMSPLHLACSNGHMNIVRFLIESCNHEIEPRNNQGALPLHMAILNGHREIARYLIDEHNSDPTLMTKDGATGFHAAAQGGHLEVLIDLLEHPRFAEFKSKLYYLPGGSPLDQAAEQGHLEIVKYLVLGGICNPRKRAEDSSFTCLHWAASKGRTDVVKFLVEDISCDLLESTLNGELPLHLACAKGHIDTVQYLLTKDKGQLNVKSNNRLTPLQLASKAGITSKEVLCSFLMAGADPDQLIEVSPGNCSFMKSCIPLYAQTKVFLLGSSKAVLNELNSLEDSTVPLVSAPVSLSYKSYKHIGDVMLYAVSEEVISFDGVLCDALACCSHPVLMICFDMVENKSFDKICSYINYWLQFISSLLSYTANKSARPLLSVVINVDSKTDVQLLDEVSTFCLSLSIPDHELVISPQVLQCDLDSLSPIHANRLIVFLSKYCNALQEHRPLELFPTALRSFVLHCFRESSLERHTLNEISCEMIVEDAPLPTDIEKLAEGFTSLSQSGYSIFLKDDHDIGESIVILVPILTLQKTYEVVSEIASSVNLDFPRGQQPNHLNGQLSLLKYLINEHSCDPNAENNSGKPLAFSGECRKVEVMNYLVEEKGHDPSHTARANGKAAANHQAIHGACFSGSGRRVDPYAYAHVQDATGCNFACLKDRCKLVEFLSTDSYGSIEHDQYVTEMSNQESSSSSESGWSEEDDHGTSNQDSIEEMVTETASILSNEAIVGLAEATVETRSFSDQPTSTAQTESLVHVHEPTFSNGIDSNNDVNHSDILYTGMMYHERRDTDRWITRYTAAKDFNALLQYVKNNYPKAEIDGANAFMFNQHPNGIMKLTLGTPRETGWTVHPHQVPMELHQSVLDSMQSPMVSTIQVSVYAVPGAAVMPLHCPIKLTGINPFDTFYINRPPLLLSTGSTSTYNNNSSHSMQQNEDSMNRRDIADATIRECAETIRDALRDIIDVTTLLNKLVERRLINDNKKREFLDERSTNQRINHFISLVRALVKNHDDAFRLFVEMIEEENTLISDRLAQMLKDTYTRLLSQ